VRRVGLGLACCLLATRLWAQPVVDGSKDVAYGAALAVQTVETHFGDGSPLGGSELDGAYAVIAGGRLYLMLTGNLEPNFNTLEVFIDSKAGGENVLSATPQYDLLFLATASAKFTGMTFDTGFSADYHLVAQWGSNPNLNLYAHFVDRMGGGAALVPGSSGTSPIAVGNTAAGTILAGNIGPSASGTALTQNLPFAINNSNTLGVIGGTAAANAAAAAAVTTGVEFSIALADLGNPAPGGTIRIFAAINNGNHDYLSNQILAGLVAPQGNLGGDGAGGFIGSLSGIDFTDFAGDQYFSLQVPGSLVEPAIPTLSGWGAALLALALAWPAWSVLVRR
jgi:hypothetical protein